MLADVSDVKTALSYNSFEGSPVYPKQDELHRDLTRMHLYNVGLFYVIGARQDFQKFDLLENSCGSYVSNVSFDLL